MNQIGSILEEKIKEQLNYEHKPISSQRKLFDNLICVCIMKQVQIKVVNHHIKGVLIHLHRSGKPIGNYWAKPVIRNGRIYLSFNKPIKKLIDASHVDVFGKSIHNPK